MRVGPILRNVGEPSRSNMLAVARATEELGYQSLWATTHTAIPVHFESRYQELEEFAAEVLPAIRKAGV